MAKKKPEAFVSPEDARKKEIDDLMHKYKQELRDQLKTNTSAEELEVTNVTSKEYRQFRNSYMPKHLSWYEKACNLSEKILKIKPDPKKELELNEAIDICHLGITPAGATSFAILLPVILMLLGIIIFYAIFTELFFVIFFLFGGLMLMLALPKLPFLFANEWRLRASNQMVLCIFYIVTYMRHSSNLELAIEFASDHLSAPLNMDLRKVLWNVEVEKYASIKESLDQYLETWKKWNLEFIEAFHLVESSLYEGNDERRINLLEKALSTMLDETYEKMLHFAQNIQSPLTTLYMLGIIMPILGLVILPLVVAFMCNVSWYHIGALYNIALPAMVYWMGKNILSSRPTGYGDTDIAENNPEFQKYKNVLFKIGNYEVKLHPIVIACIVGVVFFVIGIAPLLAHTFIHNDETGNYPDLVIFRSPGRGESKVGFTNNLGDSSAQYSLLGYRSATGCGENDPLAGTPKGPYGLGSSILSLAYVISAGIGIGLFFRLRSKNIIKIRNAAKSLEKEFGSALFQLGNRLGDGIPAEIAFQRVANTLEGTSSGNFFSEVSQKITRLGMNVEDAIFHPKYGAILGYPSNLISSSMKVLVESAKKGPQTAAQALINVSIYIKEIHRVDERLKDLLSETISSMKSQISFLTPVISGIVIGITSLITEILGKLRVQIEQIGANAVGGQAGGLISVMELFSDPVPTYFFQLIVGLYVVQIVYILTIITNGIENGSDELNEKYLLGKNMIKSSLLYIIVTLVVMVSFNLIAAALLDKLLV